MVYLRDNAIDYGICLTLKIEPFVYKFVLHD